MLLKGGLEFVGNEDELVLVNSQTVYESIPVERARERFLYERIVGHSQKPEYISRGQLAAYALQAWGQKNLPQFFYDTRTFFHAMSYYMNAEDMKATNPNPIDAQLGIWTVTAQALIYYETTSEAMPCFDRYRTEQGHFTYYGWTPRSHRASPYPAPCIQQFEIYEIEQRNGFNHNNSNDAFRWDPTHGNSTTYTKGGGMSAELETMEVTEGGLIYVSLPDLPFGASDPPPLVGYVVDYGPPGPQGPPGPPGPPGSGGGTPDPEEIVSALCSLPDADKEAFRDCLNIPEQLGYAALVNAATNLEVQAAAQMILDRAPTILLPEVEVILLEEGVAAMEATALPTGGWSLVLTLPILALIGMKLLLEDIYAPACDLDNNLYAKRIPFPTLSINEKSQKEAFQEIFRQFSYLLKCCPPCDNFAWTLYGEGEGSQSILFDYPVSAFRLVVNGGIGPEINTWYGSTNIFKLGEVRLRYAHKQRPLPGNTPIDLGELQFWNSINQNFYLKGGNVIGFDLEMEQPIKYELYVLPVRTDAHGLRL